MNIKSSLSSILIETTRIFVPGLICLLNIAISESAKAAPEIFARDDRIGVCTHFAQNWSVDQVMPLIATSGVGWIRDEIYWKEMEPTRGNYQIPPKTRGWIDAARHAGLKVLLILAYGNPAYSDQYDTTAYAKAAGWLARALANDVQAIEILNEPQNFGFRDLYGGWWNGNEPDGSVSPYLRKYVQLLNAAAKEIKLANPRMTVIGLGTPPPASFRMIALGLAPQVDGLTDHPYGGNLPELVAYSASPEIIKRDGIATADAMGTFESQVIMFRAQARKWGATDKLWHTEWGYPTVKASPGKPGMTEETQAVYILRRLLESDAAGVEHTFIYDFKDEGVDPYSEGENFGLIHNDLSPKPAYFALQKAAELLTGTRTASSEKQASVEGVPASDQQGLGYRCHTFSSSDQQRTIVAFWNAKPWDPHDITPNAKITLPFKHDPRRVFLYDLLSRKQTGVSWKRLDRDNISIPVSITCTPQLLVFTSGRSLD
jgi:hypothetical protein